ncbi:hypothetical protein GCM10011316_00640 [Roseibium aquae]|uniref:Murein endopeptidase K n=1 Tax=Roseibium aquae TaxID=1323746 RepID=A0A916T5B1_9HYPH|nr:DUF882 domain-containing protein [Roseibium aquae]GGB32432.1 hypothetical protein GCM10011316_00640 [Roseibium aquae]
MLRTRLFENETAAGLKRGAALAIIAMMGLVWLLSGAAYAETRTLKLYNTHTKERVSVTFKKNGRYIPAGLREANRFLRDWRRNEITKIDPELLDLVWEVYQEVGARDYIHVVSSYRSPATNNMLRKRSGGVAQKSMHTVGRAMDFYIPGVNIATLRKAGLKRQVGGVGYYPRSGSPFVHLDTGRVRHWPRMSRNELAQLFPDGKTLHLPSNGKPLSGYKVAEAAERSGKLGIVNRGQSGRTLFASSAPSQPRTTGQSLSNPGDIVRPATSPAEPSEGGNLLATLFGRGNDAPTPPGAVRPQQETQPANRSVASAVSPVVEAPPIPIAKASVAPQLVAQSAADQPEAPIALASATDIAPAEKPALAGARPPESAPPGTLDAQRIALAQNAPNPASAPQGPADADRFDIAGIIPNKKPQPALLAASQTAATAPIPAPAPDNVSGNDPVAAIVAAAGPAIRNPGAPQGTLAPAPTTLAYASATAIPAAPLGTPVARSLEAPRSPASSAAPRSDDRPRPSVAGRIPRDQIKDPLAGFASLPDKSEPKLLSSEGTMRHALFASLRHPNQRTLTTLVQPGNRFVSGGFGQIPYGTLRTDRFDGPAIVVLPVTFAR